MAAVVFLTGRPGVGKSSIIERLISEARARRFSLTGFITPELRKDGRTGFAVRDIATGNERVFAATAKIPGAPKVSKYYIDLAAFESIAIPAMTGGADLRVIDEIGKMEMLSERFRTTLGLILQSDVPVVATLGMPFVSQFRKYGQVIEATPQNRAELHLRVLELIGLEQ